MKAARKALVSICSVLILSLTSCVSLEHALDPEDELEIYGGTKKSWNYMEDETSPFFGTLVRVFDFPLTVGMDTILLPISVPVALTRD